MSKIFLQDPRLIMQYDNFTAKINSVLFISGSGKSFSQAFISLALFVSAVSKIDRSRIVLVADVTVISFYPRIVP